jgi:hypothetical protein
MYLNFELKQPSLNFFLARHSISVQFHMLKYETKSCRLNGYFVWTKIYPFKLLILPESIPCVRKVHEGFHLGPEPLRHPENIGANPRGFLQLNI